MPPIDPNAKLGRDDDAVPGIQDYAMIGNLRTAAMISLTGSIDQYCSPYFDSPSVFARIVDKDKGGHFQIRPATEFTTKQAYLPSSNVLATKFLSEEGVGQVTDFLIPKSSTKPGKTFLPWLIRRVEVIRGKLTFRAECAPAFNYCRDKHETQFVRDDSQVASKEFSKTKVVFRSADHVMDLRVITSGEDLYAVAGEDSIRSDSCQKKMEGDNEVSTGKGPIIEWSKTTDWEQKGLLGPGVISEFEVREGEIVDFIFRSIPKEGFAKSAANKATETTKELAEQLGVDLKTLSHSVSKIRSDEDPVLTAKLVTSLFEQTNDYWLKWANKCSYKGRWREAVLRQALVLKMLVYEETGAIIAAPTFSLPEHIGGTRNWDYRFTWIRDSSFTLYALIRLGYTAEANAFMQFIQQRLLERNSDGSLQIMYTIHGGSEAPEEELSHLSGHKDSKPVRIGNGAVDHNQWDIYGELMDSIYLAQKFSTPLSWDMWVAVRELVDHVCTIWQKPDLSIWEVRNQEKNFVYSKVMLWVALDRGLRLADKRSLPLKQRDKWLATRDAIYEEIMIKGWNKKERFFGQSYEGVDVLDSAILIMPLTFFMSAADPRFRSTLDRILRTPEKGGLCTNNLVFRYDTSKVEDGVGGSEGAFTLCTLWAVEALARAGAFDSSLLPRAVAMFEDLLGYANHVGLLSEEISRGGEGLGNTPQGFSAVTLISTAYNLDRTLNSSHR